MAKLIIIFSLILSLSGLAFAQEDIYGPGEPGPEGGAAAGGGGGGGVLGEGGTIVDILRTMFPNATIEVDPITGTLIVKASPSVQKEIGDMIRRLDVYHPQITIEAKFVELTVTDINELGIDLDIQNIKTAGTLNEGDVDVINDWTDIDSSFPQELAGTSFWITRLNDTAFSALLRALQKHKKANVLSAPRVTTVNGQPATIEISRNIPYVSGRNVDNVGTSENPIWQTNYTIQQKDAGVYLEVTPTVPEGSTLITLAIKPTVRILVKRLTVFSGVEPAYGWPIIDTRSTDTSMVVESGESIVLGGLIKNDTSVVEKKVPLLGDIPLVGWAFRHKYSSDEKKNLLIFITAYLVSPSGEKVTGAGGTS